MKNSIQLVELDSLEQMKPNFDLLKLLYPKLTIEYYHNYLKAMLKTNSYYQLISKFESEIIGVVGYWISTKIWSGKYLELDHFVIHPNYRSKDYGKKMIEYLKKKAKDENCLILSLDTYVENFEAQRFFMKNGMIPRGYHYVQYL